MTHPHATTVSINFVVIPAATYRTGPTTQVRVPESAGWYLVLDGMPWDYLGETYAEAKAAYENYRR